MRQFFASSLISCHSAKPQNLLCSEHGVILTPGRLHATASFHHPHRRNGGGLAAGFVRAAAWQDGADRISGLRLSYWVSKISGSPADWSARSWLCRGQEHCY